MKIAITGSTGLIGRAVVTALEAGSSVTRVVRPGSHARGVTWDPQHGVIDAAGLEGHDAVIHLAGENIGGGLWTAGRKRRIRESRELGTRLLATTLAGLKNPPAVLVCASAIGFYGDHPGSDQVDESWPQGEGFLADVVGAWERACEPARAAGIRVVNTRFGLVLSRKGGALAPLLRVVRLGLGGKIGSGRQYWSWVAIDDVVGAIQLAVLRPDLAGPVNVVSPFPVTNLAFTRALGRVVKRPTVFGVPEFILKSLAGDMAEELLLFGVRVVPRKLMDAGYAFQYPELETALKHVVQV